MMSSMMENMVCRSAKDCPLIAALLGVKGEFWASCEHKKAHEEDRSCRPGRCEVMGRKVQCQSIEG